MAKVFEDTKNFQSVPAKETVSDDNEVNPAAKFDTGPKAPAPRSCVNTAEAKLDKLGKVNIFSKFSFRPKGNNTGEQGGKQEKDKPQKKTRGSCKSQGNSKSQSDKNMKDRGTKDPKSSGQKLK